MSGESPFDHHQATPNLGSIGEHASKLEHLSNKAIDLDTVTKKAFKPAEANWEGVCAPELRAAPKPVQQAAQENSSALAWAAVPLRYWVKQITTFNSEVDKIKGALDDKAATHYGVKGDGNQAPNPADVASARATATAAAQKEYHTAYDKYVTTGASDVAGMFRDGPTEDNLKKARDVGALPHTPGAFTLFPAFWHKANMEKLAKEAADLANKMKETGHRITDAELKRLKELLGQYAGDKVFAYNFLKDIGPRGLLQLNGQLASMLSSPSDPDSPYAHFDKELAKSIGAIQASLGIALATATAKRGSAPPYGGVYTPGQYELDPKWLSDLMIAGRDKFMVGGTGLGQYLHGNVYGYQLLAPLLDLPDGHKYDARFLSLVGGDMVDFEMEQGGSEFWRWPASDNFRLDWNGGYSAKDPAGFDPMINLMKALEDNPEGAKDLLTSVQETADGPKSGWRLPRLDYLLTDREWPTDTVGGVSHQGDMVDWKNVGLDTFGRVLEGATTDHPDSRSKQIVESIVYEINADEEAAGYKNDGKWGGDEIAYAKEHDGKTSPFSKTDLIDPLIRDSMGNIMKAYIYDVNHAFPGHMPGSKVGADFDQTQITRFLADLGKDKGAHDTVVKAEAAWATDMYHRFLAGPDAKGDDLAARLRSAQNVADHYGNVVGALDFGASAAGHETVKSKDEHYNDKIEAQYKVAGFLVDQAMGKATGKIPVVGDLAGGFVDDLMSQAEEAAKHDNSGYSDYTIGNLYGSGKAASARLAEVSLYNSGILHDLPGELTDGHGHPKPMSSWGDEERKAWDHYTDGQGQDSISWIDGAASNGYDGGYRSAQDTLGKHFP